MKNIFILASLLLASTFSYAQFGSLLKGLENAAKEFENAIQQSTQTVPNQSPNSESDQISKDAPSNNACSLYNNPADIWERFEGNLGVLLTLKEIKSEDAIKNLSSEEWVDRYDLGNLRIHIKSGYTLNQFKSDLPRVVSWFKNKQSGGSCPWGMQLEEVAFIVQWVNGDYWTCRNLGGSVDSCRNKKEGFYNILHGVSNIDKFHAAETKRENERKFAASPDGMKKTLRDHYTSMMAVQDCHDIRKNYVLKYIDTSIFNQARSAMRQIENTAKKEIPGLNTDREWQIATKEYSESAIGQSLSFNKKMPQNYDESIKGMCNIMSMSLLEALPKEAPKRNF
jgi:hypothetical protein